MGKRTARSFNGLAIFVFLLYFANVSSNSIRTSIIDVMKNDKNLDQAPPVFLYTNTNISTCVNVSYPEGDITDYSYKKTFLCLAFYDTWYKVCKSSVWSDRFRNNFTDAKTFNNYLLKLAPKENNNNSEVMFCESIKGLTFSYKKLKPWLSHLKHLNSYDTCHPLCYDIDGKFTPLCEILAWSKSIDNDDQKVFKESQTGLESKKVEKSSQTIEEVQKPKDSKTLMESPVILSKLQSAAKVSNNNNINEDKSVSAPNETTKPPNSLNKPTETSIANPNSAGDEKHTNDHTILNLEKADDKPTHFKDTSKVIAQPHNDKNEQPHSDKQEPKSVNAKTSNDLETQNINEGSHNEVKKLQNTNKASEEIGVNTAKENIEENVKENNEENVKEINNEDKTVDWTNAEDNGLMDDQNNTGEPDTPIDTDQPQNIHKPLEEKDNISSFRAMRTDEESHFFTYFTVLSLISIAAYIGYYNKQKILAIVLEGRRSRNSRGRRRPSTANYRKLDCTLEEAVTSQCNANVTHVIY
ncbi:uncharacterized protein LOC144469848 [Augochlora pura]